MSRIKHIEKSPRQWSQQLFVFFGYDTKSTQSQSRETRGLHQAKRLLNSKGNNTWKGSPRNGRQHLQAMYLKRG